MSSSPGLFLRPRRIRFEHCDPAGIVFFPQYLVMFVGLIEDWIHEELGIPYAELIGARRIGLPTVQLACDFRYPGRMGDAVALSLRVARLGNRSFTLEMGCRDATRDRLTVRQTIVTTSLDTHRPIPIPADLRAAMLRFDPSLDTAPPPPAQAAAGPALAPVSQGDGTAGQVLRPLIGLIGADIQRSLTPAMHEAAGAALGLDIRYQLIDTARLGRGAADLAPMLEGVRRLGFAGVNVTHPFKEAVCPHLDAIEGAARHVGSVNTVVVRDGRLIGWNTDISGFLAGWRRNFAARLPGRAALIGAGGAGRAIAHALAELGCTALALTDLARDRAERLAAELAAAHPRLAITIAADAEAACAGADGAVNATPIGMHAHPGLPLRAEALAGRAWVADAVYTPLETGFLAAGRRAGAAVLTGQDMAIGQAVDAFALFFGRPAPEEVMRATFQSRLAGG
jgi:shikimate dehydrogenase